MTAGGRIDGVRMRDAAWAGLLLVAAHGIWLMYDTIPLCLPDGDCGGRPGRVVIYRRDSYLLPQRCGLWGAGVAG